MKKIKNLFLLTMLFALCSCGNSIDSDPAEYSQQVVTNGTLYNIKSKMDGSTYKNCSVKLSNLMNLKSATIIQYTIKGRFMSR